ncbi:MAG TPA: hypothetical protein VHO23_02260, partial [Candidatus Paceibacterota bacterium]|nr:hypothetical protein [Candidatus Paceibacterota bacterium]
TNAQAISVSGNDNDYATFEVIIDLEAFGGDMYIPQDADDALTYEIVGSDGDVITTSTSESAIITSSADEEGDYFVIREDSSEEFTFRVTFDPSPSDEGESYKFQLLTVRYSNSEAAPNRSWTAHPAGDYDTQFVYIND